MKDQHDKTLQLAKDLLENLVQDIRKKMPDFADAMVVMGFLGSKLIGFTLSQVPTELRDEGLRILNQDIKDTIEDLQRIADDINNNAGQTIN